MKKLFSGLFLVLFLSVGNSQVPTPLGPPEIPPGATVNEFGFGLYFNGVKNKLQNAVVRVNHAIDSMSSSTGVNATVSHSVRVTAPVLSSTTSDQLTSCRNKPPSAVYCYQNNEQGIYFIF